MPTEPTADTNTLVIKYTYEFDDGHRRTHEVHLDEETLELRESQQHPLPEWTQLENHKCPNCPLTPEQQAHCPAAVALTNVATGFGERPSYSPVKVTVDTPSRTITKETSLAEALFPLVGLRMATSGCPVLRQLRPMARFHLPFADFEETAYRAISMYLVSQFLRQSKGLPASFDLRELGEIYEGIHQVNMAFSQRLAQASASDANINSLTTLDMFAQDVPLSIESALTCLGQVFAPYLQESI